MVIKNPNAELLISNNGSSLFIALLKSNFNKEFFSEKYSSFKATKGYFLNKYFYPNGLVYLHGK